MSESGGTPDLLIVGASGLLGQALMAEARSRGMRASGLARSGADYACDLRDTGATTALLAELRPAIIVNAAALTDLRACEADPGLAYEINARAVALLAESGRQWGARLVHVSTDHFFCGDGAAPHDEKAPVRLVNDYARSKFAGEGFAATAPGALVVRTNITGFRGWAGRPTFAEWLFEMIETDGEAGFFDDYWTSTMDAATCARALLTLVEKGASGLLNVAARRPATKQRFAEALASAMGRRLSRARTASVRDLLPRRAESAGLEVSAAEAILGHRLPDLDDVIHSLLSEYQTRCATIPPS